MKKHLTKNIFVAALVLLLPLLFVIYVSAPTLTAHAAVLSISSAIPGNFPTANATSSVPGAFIANFYQLALMLGGVLALGAIVYGGVLYAISAGNSSKQTEGKEWIESALIGLLLLAGAYLVLFTINPNLVNLNLPAISTVGSSGNFQSQQNCTIGANNQLYCNGQAAQPAPINTSGQPLHCTLNSDGSADCK